MKHRTLMVIFDKTTKKILLSTRGPTFPISDGFDSKEDRVAAILNQMNLNLQDVSLLPVMDVHSHTREQVLELYVAHLEDGDPTVDCRHLIWRPVQFFDTTAGSLSGGTGIERFLTDYAITMVVYGYIKFPDR